MSQGSGICKQASRPSLASAGQRLCAHSLLCENGHGNSRKGSTCLLKPYHVVGTGVSIWGGMCSLSCSSCEEGQGSNGYSQSKVLQSTGSSGRERPLVPSSGLSEELPSGDLRISTDFP